MTSDRLCCDPVFQFNMLLWMAKEQPGDDFRVRPLLWELGFEIIYIEHQFALPPNVAEAAKSSGLDISAGPEPELIVARDSDQKALYFEAKSNSFGTASTTCKQARGHLLACGPAFTEVLSLKNCLLCYLVPDEKRNDMAECLVALAKELKAKSLQPGMFSAHGLKVHENSIIYTWDPVFKTYVVATEDSVILIKDIEPQTDPSPLILVYTDEDCPNAEQRGFYRRVMIEQVRAKLLCELHSGDVGLQYETSLQKLLEQTTDGIFYFLGHPRQTSLVRLIRDNFIKRIVDHWSSLQPGMIASSNDVLTIRWTLTTLKEEFLDWLQDRQVKFGDERPEDETTLFDSVDDNPR